MQLDALQKEYKNLFNHFPCGIHAIDDRGYFTEINMNLLRALGYEREELLGKVRFVDLVDEADRILVEKAVSVVKEKGSPKGHFSFVTKGGDEYPVTFRVLRGTRSVFYCTIDNTECKQALDRIKNLDQELEAFSYSISHDLRAPLRSIDGYSKILQEDYADRLDDEGRRVLNVIMNNARRMGKLIDDLLDFSRLGRKEIQPSRVDMTAMVNNIVSELVRREPGRKIEMKVEKLDSAIADAEMIRTVWFNLLENAFKFTGKKDTALIEIRSSDTPEGEVCYQVKDNGVGFDMQYAPKLFGVFQRLHKIQDFPGTGVGLAIVKRIVSRHGGRVWTDARLNEGAIFYFTLPIDHHHA